MNGESTKFLLDQGRQKSSRPSEHESNLNRKSRESWPLSWVPDLSQVQTENTLNDREAGPP